jgi:hypothetical protein
MSLTLSGQAFQAKQASDPAATSKNPDYSLLRPVGIGCIEAAAFGAVLAQVGNLPAVGNSESKANWEGTQVVNLCYGSSERQNARTERPARWHGWPRATRTPSVHVRPDASDRSLADRFLDELHEVVDS